MPAKWRLSIIPLVWVKISASGNNFHPRFAAMPDTALRPFSIRIFVPGGDPDGLRLVEKSNWTGIGVVFSRSNFKEAVSRPEVSKTGVYVLVGSADDSALPMIYVGEGDPVKERLAQHQQKKDFWDWAVFFATKDDSLNKAHVQHLESRLCDLARAAKQCKLDNLQTPTSPTLSEAERADVESFLLDVLSIFPLLGLGVFEHPGADQRRSDRQVLRVSARGVHGAGYEDARGFVVCKGTEVAGDEVPSIHQYLVSLRADLRASGVIAEQGGKLIFTQDYVFGSPSTAAGVILGRSANGRELWKADEGRTLRQIQAAE